ncbi:unnamed protein product [Albugo candida]|uniref:Uncharacterized protein n=2 Tax=Albugo candida TaxID=65357 RepID=A0A024G9J6_9STRA|nr:unnamed protein product [Albugo candida]|eukprot:CCI42987.1 unnamed protein product [Albugo candida]
MTPQSADRNRTKWSMALEAELEKVRTEGDVIYVKTQAERKSIEETNKMIKATEARLKEQRKQEAEFVYYSKNQQHHRAGNRARNGRQLYLIEKQENRLQSISSERNNELRRLRKRVDSLRHIKMEEAMKEAKLTEEIRQKKMVNHHLQADIEIYKKKQLLLKEETSALQRELEIEKNEYRIKDRELGAKLSNVLRESTQDTTRSSEKEDNRFREVANSLHPQILQARKTMNHMTSTTRLNLEEHITSFEQKKSLLEQLRQESQVSRLDDFIAWYIEQEVVKKDIYNRIQAISLENAALRETSAKNEQKIAHLQKIKGVAETAVAKSSSAAAATQLEIDRALSLHWAEEQEQVSSKIQALRLPLQSLWSCISSIPEDNQGYEQHVSDDQANLLQMLGSIEERVMLHIMRQSINSQEDMDKSEILRRFRKYRGLEKRSQLRYNNFSELTNIAWS